jgi:uncharacterized protein (DUF1501 family)
VSNKPLMTRRRMLSTLGLSAGAWLMRDLVLPTNANADAATLAKRPLLVFAYFSGGWDTLLTLDPRDGTKYNDPAARIQTAYDRVCDSVPAIESVMMDCAGTGLVKPAGSNITFGPAIGKIAANHHQDLCVVRGVEMSTLTHEVGRRYFLTGKFPRGLAASGSSLPTWVVHDDPGASVIPNLVVGGVETYNEGLDPRAAGLMIRSSSDLSAILKPLVTGNEPNDATKAALTAYAAENHCIHEQIGATGLVNSYRAAMQNAEILSAGTLWQNFDFRSNPVDPAIQELYAAFGINAASPSTDLAGPKGQVAIAAQALTQNISQVVSIQVASGLDTHDDDWESIHAPKLIAGFDALSDLISFLKTKTDPNGLPYWDRTVLVCFSEFARTPSINVRGGRDHHLSNACLVAGMGIKGNTVIGATGTDDYASRSINLATGAVEDGGTPVRPADIHATVLQAMGLSYDHISNQSPKVIDAMLKG